MLCHLALVSLNHRLWEVIFNTENKGLELEGKESLYISKERNSKCIKSVDSGQ